MEIEVQRVGGDDDLLVIEGKLCTEVEAQCYGSDEGEYFFHCCIRFVLFV